MNTELRNKRMERGLTQSQLAQQGGIATRSYQRIESGKIANADTAIIIAEILGITDFEEFKAVFRAAPPTAELSCTEKFRS